MQEVLGPMSAKMKDQGGIRIRFDDASYALLEETLQDALRVAATRTALTHPTAPEHDAYTRSQARLRALLLRVQMSGAVQ